jgi:hypothetical protein
MGILSWIAIVAYQKFLDPPFCDGANKERSSHGGYGVSARSTKDRNDATSNKGFRIHQLDNRSQLLFGVCDER